MSGSTFGLFPGLGQTVANDSNDSACLLCVCVWSWLFCMWRGVCV